MVKSKKLSKSSIAVIVLALMLVLSMIMGITAAWFTDAKKESSSTLTFGDVEMTITGSGLHAYRAADVTKKDAGAVVVANNAAKDAKVMPGDYVVMDRVIAKKTAEHADFYYMLFVSVSGEGIGNDQKSAIEAKSSTDAVLVNDSAEHNVSLAVELPGNVYGDSYETKTFTITYEIRAIQAANLTPEQAKKALKADANWKYDEGGKYTENGAFTIGD